MARASRANTGHVNGWRTVELAPLVLLYGSDDYFAQRAKERLRQLYQEREGSYELATLSAKDYKSGQLGVITSPSLFDEPKIIEIENVAQMSDDFLIEALDYAQNPSSTAIVVLSHSGGNRGKKLIDTVRASRTFPLVECKPLKTEKDKTDFVLYEFRALGKKITPDAAQALAQATSDTAELASACRQLHADGPDTIDISVVDRYYGGRTEVTAFKVSDASVAGNSREAVKLLRQALDTGSDPIPMLGALALRMRNIAKVHGMRGSAQQLASDFKMAPWQVEVALRDSRRYSAGDIADIMQVLADTDAALKGENLDALYPLEKAVLTVSRVSQHQ